MKQLLLLTLGLSLLTSAFSTLALEPFISEFVPDNAGVATDEDGQYADLIEIQNPNATPFNLGGYYLTDNPLNLTKWAFPPVTLPGNGFLVVFASGKNRIADTNRLHTNFQLNKGGGYLALVKPDGSNIVNAFVNYPAVKEDVAYGIAQKLVVTQPLLGTIPRVLVPTNAPGLPADWNLLSYTPDASWTNGIAPPALGFDTNQTGGLPVNVAPSGTAAQSTTFNGTTYPANLAINGLLTDFTHTASTDNNAFWQVTLTNEMSIYEVVIFNRGGGCCQWRLRDITVTIVSTNLAGSVTNWISPLLNPENVLNGPGYLTNNLVTLTGGPVLGRTIIIHRKPDPDNSGLGTGTAADDQNVLSMGEVVITASLGSGLQPYFTTDIKNLMYQKNPSAFVRMPFVSTNTPDTLTLNVRYDDGFVAYLNGTEVARRNAPGSLAFDSVATVNRALTNVTMVESIDLSTGIPSLINGTNLLAVQILNHSTANGDALFQPQLIATVRTQTTNVFLEQVTMGALNDVPSYLDYVKDTHFSIDRGYFTNAFSLSITSGTPDALVYVSFNGDEPGPGKGFLYTNAFTITNTTVVRTRAFKANWKPSDVDSASYLFVADIIQQAKNWPAGGPPQYFPATWGANSVDYGMDPQVVTNYTLAQWYEAFYQIGTMSIVTEMTNLFDATTGIYANATGQGDIWERPISLELIDPTNAVHGRFQENAGLRIRGGASRSASFYKHSFRVYFRKEYGAGKLKYPLFEDEGADEFDVFALRTSQNYSWPRNDNSTQDTMVREVFCRKTLGDMGQPYRRSRYYHLFLNGQYWGLYETDEHPAASYGETYFGGDKDNYDVVKNHDRYTSPPPAFSTEATDGNLIAFSNLWTMCRTHAAAPTQSNYFAILGCNPDGTRNTNLPVMVEVDNLIDYMLSIFYTGDGDATLSAFLANNRPNNWYGMRDRTNPNAGFRFFNNDCEHTLGSPNSQVDRTGPFRNAAGSNIGIFTYANPQYLHEDLMWSPEYRQKFADHVQRHFFNNGALTLQSSTNRFIAKAKQITKAIRAYSARWGDPITDGLARAPYGEADWTNTLNTILTTWFPPRAGIVLAQLQADGLFGFVGAPQLSQYGGPVAEGFTLDLTHTNATGVIYFTTDGSDPRAVGGGVSPTALAYSGSIPIPTQTIIRVRVLTGGVWSGLLEYTFFPPYNLSNLRLTEIMYRPPAVGLVDGDEFEFLEFKNTGANTLNLSGLRFTSGITFQFTNGTLLAPGQFFVLARNPSQFAAVHPGVAVNGLYSGRLDNAGETLTLSHALGATVFSMTYSDLPPWPMTPDGYGFSLVPVNPNANPAPSASVNWRPSTLIGGSPGADDPANNLAPILVNEVFSHSVTNLDFIELFNPTTNVVNIGGWLLTDDPAVPQKYRIPDGTEIQPLSYVWFDETHFNPIPGTLTNFSLGSFGDEAYLFSAEGASQLTGYSHGFAFGASPEGVSFGRYVNSVGEEQFPLQISRTLGGVNSGPRVGPLVMSEIHYNPRNNADEFVEVRNISGAPVPLFDPAAPTNTWKLNGVGFNFPTNFTLDANGTVLLVLDTPALFRARFGVSTQISIFQYTGNLQDSGELMELQAPDLPTTNGVPYYTVDGVRFNDKRPWPLAADGAGASLQRINPSAYGNDPINWIAASPTPGTQGVSGTLPSVTGHPSSRSALLGQSAVFSVSAAGTGPLRYQWLFKDNNIQDATNVTLTLNNLIYAQAGDYSVVVFNGAGSVQSSNAALTVLIPPTINVQPVDVDVRVRPDMQPDVAPFTNATFTVSAVSSNPPLTYLWRMNGTNITATNIYGLNSATLTVSNVTMENFGQYSCLLTDSNGSLSSAPATLYPLVRPLVWIGPPTPLIVPAAQPVSVSVVLSNGFPPPYGYQWRSNALAIATPVSNSKTNFFVIPSAFISTNAISSTFRVIVSNRAVPSFQVPQSATFTLITQLDTDRDGIPDLTEIALGLMTNNAADALLDLDGDGLSNLAEYQAGTNPNDTNSYLRVVLATSNNLANITVAAVSNRTYTVQYSDVLPASWSRLADLIARTNNRVELLVDPAWVTNRFYRVVTPRQP